MNHEEFLNRLSICLSKYPNLRFGQFINNAFAVATQDGLDPFFMSDDEMIEFLERYTGPSDLRK